MVTHELTVFPDGRIDGAFSVREGDYNSHILRFVLMQDLTAASAKLLLWPADEEKPTVYGTLLGRGQASGQDVQFTPVSWGKAPSQTQIQLELLDNNGNIIWQSCRLGIPVEPGVPDDAKREPADTSDATAGPGDVRLGKTFYAQGEKKTGTYVTDGAHPRAWSELPIDHISFYETDSTGEELYCQRTGDFEFLLILPPGTSATIEDNELYVHAACAMRVYKEAVLIDTLTQDEIASFGPNLDGTSFAAPLILTLTWGDDFEKSATIKITIMTETADYACLEVASVKGAGKAASLSNVVAREGEVFYYYSLGAQSLSLVSVVATFYSNLASVLCNDIAYSISTSKTCTLSRQGLECFLCFELVSPKGNYRKKYCVAWYNENATTFTLDIYAYPVLAAKKGDTAFYDYAGAGFAVLDTTASTARLASALNGGSKSGVKDTYGRIAFGLGLIDAADRWAYDYSSEKLVTKHLRNILQAAFAEGGYTCVFSAPGDLVSVTNDSYGGLLGSGNVTKGSRWLLFVNQRLIDMPGFITNVWPDGYSEYALLYTCADGLDIGYPYMGA